MAYVLFVLWFNKVIMSQEFTSKDSCMAAGQEINQRWDVREHWGEDKDFGGMDWVCVPK